MKIELKFAVGESMNRLINQFQSVDEIAFIYDFGSYAQKFSVDSFVGEIFSNVWTDEVTKIFRQSVDIRHAIYNHRLEWHFSQITWSSSIRFSSSKSEMTFVNKIIDQCNNLIANK